MRYLGLLLFLFCGYCASAQLKPAYFPEDIPESLNTDNCVYCKPGIRNKSRSRGVEIAYGFNPRGTFKQQSSQLNLPLPSYNRLDYFLVDLKVPLVNKDHFKMLFSYKFSQEFYDISETGTDFSKAFQSLASNPLKSNSLGLIISKPIDENSYFAFQVKYTSNGNYRSWMQFKEASSIYKLRAIYGLKNNDDFEWGIGLSLAQSFRRFSMLPFIMFNKNFRDKWGLEAILPAVIFVRYNLNSRNIFLFGPQYASRSYRITEFENTVDPFDYSFNHSRIVTSLRWERQLVPWIWAHLQTGYQINFASEFASQNAIRSFDADPTDAAYFQISIFVSPPKM